MGRNGWDIAAVLGVFVAVQTIEGYILTPKIIGGRLNLHPMAVFLGLLVGGKLFGLLRNHSGDTVDSDRKGISKISPRTLPSLLLLSRR